ncbi:MAG: ABC transporter ATP-binding protein/permease [Candidatus Eremiobacteraeota bacterium]|nr:ABC transporter ATP-binding protein/permease [Candidatus Eremiobacteraeota bacterium]
MTRRETLGRLAREARPYYPRLAIAMVLGTLAGLSNLVAPWGFNVLVNNVLTLKDLDLSGLSSHCSAQLRIFLVATVSSSAHTSSALGRTCAREIRTLLEPHRANLHDLYVVLGAIFLALMLGAFATYGQTYITALSGQHLIKRMRVRLFERVLHLPLAGFDKWRPGELIARFSNDLQLMTDAVSISLPQLIVNTVTFISSLVAMIYLDWLLTLVLLVVAPLVSFAVSTFQKLISAATTGAQARIADLSSNLTEVLAGQRIVKSFNREQYETQRFSGRNDQYFGTYMKLTQFVQTQPLVLSVLMTSSIVLIIYLSVHEVVVARRLNVGQVFEFWALLVNLINPMNRFAAFVADIEKALVGAGRVYEILDLPTERADNPGAIALRDVSGRIAFENVHFSYGEHDRPAIDDLSAVIEAGEVVALVGPSGAGKTTIVNMVPRFYEPQRGRITLDGVDISNVKLADLRGAIGIVPQEAQLFRGSVTENIRYGRLNATDDEVRSAAREANAEEFVLEFPDGYDTEVGERGSRLSGGQRQRISIARAILRDPRILILDEATSALDSHSEVLIEQALDRLLPGRTTLIIAHRLSTIRRAHKIFYIEAGRVIEVGSHEALLANRGAYSKLYATQFG